MNNLANRFVRTTPFYSKIYFLKGSASLSAKVRSFSSNGNSNSNGWNWGKPLSFAALAGLGVFYFYKSKGKDANPLSSLERLADNVQVIFVLGGPGAGKGTQCSRLVKDFQFEHLSAGDLLRAERSRPDSQFSQLINSYISEGKIVPMEITIALLHAAMKNSKSNKFLIDGFPRKMDQAIQFEKVVAPAKFILYFECPEAEMLKRLMKRGETSGRLDDNIESIKKRFQTFRDTSYPVIEYYAGKGLVRKISCLDSVDKVYKDTKSIIAKEITH